MLSNEAILYYANHPVEFVQDILKADPDPEQKKILRSLVTNQMTSVRSGHMLLRCFRQRLPSQLMEN